MPSRAMERDSIPSWGTLGVSHEVERLLAQIKELDSSIGRDMKALSRAGSKHVSDDVWARIRLKMVKRRELRDRLPGPPLSN